MTDATFTVTPQMLAMMTPEMRGLMTNARQTLTQTMTTTHLDYLQESQARIPKDTAGKSFVEWTPCVVQQPPRVADQLPPTLVGAVCRVLSTAGERVRVRYPNGEEREFHKSELGVQ